MKAVQAETKVNNLSMNDLQRCLDKQMAQERLATFNCSIKDQVSEIVGKLNAFEKSLQDQRHRVTLLDKKTTEATLKIGAT